MKKILFLLLVVLMLVSVLVVPAYAGNDDSFNDIPFDDFCKSCAHEFDNVCDAYCNLCGDVREVGDHEYDNNCDADCNVCGEIRDIPGHVYSNNCDRDCNVCNGIRVAPHSYENVCDDTCDVCGNVRVVEPHVYTDECDIDCNKCGVIRKAPHVYDYGYDADCNNCGFVRKVEQPIAFAGNSVHENVSGLAFRFDMATVGMAKGADNATAIFDTATVNGHKLLGMGAIATNGFETIDVPCVFLCNLKESSASFAVRIINIPEDKKDVSITLTPYFVIEINGVATTIYGEAQISSFNEALSAESDTPGTTLGLETDEAKILEDAFKLGRNETTPYIAQLTGKVYFINNYDEEYGSITLTITVGGKHIVCYQMKGNGIDRVKIGDTITVQGVIKNFYYDDADTSGHVEFAWHQESGTEVTMVSHKAAAALDLSSPAKILAAAKALGTNESLPQEVTLTGKVTSIAEAYSDTYQNMSVYFTVEDTTMMCYRMTGTGVHQIKTGDTITVKGIIMNYGGNLQFGQGCVMTKRVSGTASGPETNEAKILADAFALAPGTMLSYQATLTGTITEIYAEYDPTWQNITVIIEVGGKTLKCYRLKGAGADKLAVGDVITVTGIIKNYQHSSGDCEVEFDQGCTFVSEDQSGGEDPDEPDSPDEPDASTEPDTPGTASGPETDEAKILADAFALAPGAMLPYQAKLTGKITEIYEEYNPTYGNITVIIEVGGKTLKCYRLKGTGADKLAVGDVITVTGLIKHYMHTSSGNSEIEFDQGCTFVSEDQSGGEDPDESDTPTEPDTPDNPIS